MMIVGLTGGIGSGKTTVANFFAKYNNVAIYIADVEAKKLMNTSLEIKKQIKELFGQESYKEGQLNRNYISKIVFNNPSKLTELNGIVHPIVRKHFKDFKNQQKNKSYIIYEAAILFEANTANFCDKIISVYADMQTRIKRVAKRDNITNLDVEDRIKNQWKENKKHLLSNYIIYNIDYKATELQVQKIHNILTKNRR